MKNLTVLLDNDDDDDITIGLVMLTKRIADYEFFYIINQLNNTEFQRIDDLKKIGKYYDYYHSRFEAHLSDNKTCIQFISNQSTESFQKKTQTELFSEENDISWLLPNYKEVEYIIKTSDSFADFSVILFPENLMFNIHELKINSEDKLYQLLQYYE